MDADEDMEGGSGSDQPANDEAGDTLVEQDLEEIEDPDPDPEPVVYTGTDFDVEGLVRRLQRGDIVIPSFGGEDANLETDRFQRSFVWRRSQMDRFIESLLLGYPIPGIFLVQQTDKRYLVLDGQQRLSTLRDFYRGTHRGREFALSSVADRLKGLTYERLDPEQRRTLDNTFVQATIVRTDGSPESLDSVYQVFERLNAGGTQLTPHEIRVALYAGPFIDLITGLNRQKDWRSLYGNESPRLRDQELVLRIVALSLSAETYKRPLKKFLNDFAGEHRFLKGFPVDVVKDRFAESARIVSEGPGGSALRGRGKAVNAALTEAIFVGLYRQLESGTAPDPTEVGDAIGRMLQNPDFDTAISRATADEENVRTRLAVATAALAGT
jgi:hypothetical protein